MKKNTFTPIEKWTLLATILASSMVFVDSTALNVALPALQKELGVTGTQLLWIVNAYALFLSSLILVGGALGDRFGRNKIFLVGLILFILSSAAAGLASSPENLIIARAFQGTGGALLTPGSLSILSAQVEDGRRGTAIGLWSTFSALTGVIGPALGGWLAAHGLWRVIFFLNIPLGLIVFWAIMKKVPESKDPNAKRLDVLGALLVILSFGGISYGLIESSNLGFENVLIQLSLGVGVLCLVLFYVSQRLGKSPMLPLRLFRSKTFSATNLLTLFLYAALSAISFFMPLNLVQVQGYKEDEAGFAVLPMILILSALSPFAGKIVNRFGVRFPLVIGPILVGVGFYLFGLPKITEGPTDYWHTFLPAFIVMGVGLGTTVAPLTTAVMSSIPKESSGIASGVNNAIARVAGVLAIAIFGTLILFAFKNQLAENTAPLNLSESNYAWLMEEAKNLGATPSPPLLGQAAQEEVQRAIKISFLQAIKNFTLISAGLTWLSALIAFIFIEKKPKKHYHS